MIFDLGSIIPIPAGEWTAETNYHALYIVTLNGGSYISKVDNNKGHPVTDTNYWQQIAAPGEVGPAGAGVQGVQGVQGATGAQGPAGSGSGSGAQGAQGAQGSIGRQGNGWWWYRGRIELGQTYRVTDLVGGNNIAFKNELIIDVEGNVFQIVDTDGRTIRAVARLFRVVGRAGQNGTQGATGATGATGAQGATGATGPAGMGIFVEELAVGGSDKAEVGMKPNVLFDLKETEETTTISIKWDVNEQYLPNPGQVRFAAIKNITLEVTIEGGDASTLVYRTGVEGFENGIFKQGYTYLITVYGDMIDIKSFKAK